MDCQFIFAIPQASPFFNMIKFVLIVAFVATALAENKLCTSSPCEINYLEESLPISIDVPITQITSRLYTHGTVFIDDEHIDLNLPSDTCTAQSLECPLIPGNYPVIIPVKLYSVINGDTTIQIKIINQDDTIIATYSFDVVAKLMNKFVELNHQY